MSYVAMVNILTVNVLLRLLHPPLPQPDEVHPGAAVGGGQDEPLVDDGAATHPLDISPLSSTQEAEEGKLSNAGVLPAEDEGEAGPIQSALLAVQGREVAGAVWVGRPQVTPGLTANFLLLRTADQRSEFLQQPPSLLGAPGHSLQLRLLNHKRRAVVEPDTLLTNSTWYALT